MRISKIKKFAPSPNTLFIGTDANTGDTYNFLGSYVSGNARGDFYSDINHTWLPGQYLNLLQFNGSNENFISGFTEDSVNNGVFNNIKALKTGIFQVILKINLQSNAVTPFGIWVQTGINVNSFADIPNSGQRIQIPVTNEIDTQSFKWMLKFTEGDIIRFYSRHSSGTINVNKIDPVIPSVGSYSIQLIINEIQV